MGQGWLVVPTIGAGAPDSARESAETAPPMASERAIQAAARAMRSRFGRVVGALAVVMLRFMRRAISAFVDFEFFLPRGSYAIRLPARNSTVASAQRHTSAVAGQSQLERLVDAEVAQCERIGGDLEERPRRRQADELAVVDVGPGLSRQASHLAHHGRDARALPIDEVGADLRHGR